MCKSPQVSQFRKPAHQFLQPDHHFNIVHTDIVGPLRWCQGFCYLLTSIDRFTCWPEAMPIQDSSAAMVAARSLTTVVAQFGCPTKIAIERAQQFEQTLFQELLCFLGTNRLHTVAYHPQNNGLVEGFYRQVSANCPQHAITMSLMPNPGTLGHLACLEDRHRVLEHGTRLRCSSASTP